MGQCWSTMLSLSCFALIGILMLSKGTLSFQRGPVVPEDLELIRAGNHSWGAAGAALPCWGQRGFDAASAALMCAQGGLERRETSLPCSLPIPELQPLPQEQICATAAPQKQMTALTQAALGAVEPNAAV